MYKSPSPSKCSGFYHFNKSPHAYLARVFLPVLVAGTEEGVPDCLLVSGGVEHFLAAEVVNHGDRDLVQDVRHSATWRKNNQG